MKSKYLAELFLNWVIGGSFPSPPEALYLGFHTTDPDISEVGECDVFGLKQRRLVEPASLGISSHPSKRLILTNTQSLELGEVKVAWRGVLYLAVWDRQKIGDGNLLFYAQLPQPRELIVGDRVVIPAQALKIEEN